MSDITFTLIRLPAHSRHTCLWTLHIECVCVCEACPCSKNYLVSYICLCMHVSRASSPWAVPRLITPRQYNKNPAKFGQGLDFLKVWRGKSRKAIGKTMENDKKTKGRRAKRATPLGRRRRRRLLFFHLAMEIRNKKTDGDRGFILGRPDFWPRIENRL